MKYHVAKFTKDTARNRLISYVVYSACSEPVYHETEHTILRAAVLDFLDAIDPQLFSVVEDQQTAHAYKEIVVYYLPQEPLSCDDMVDPEAH